MVTCPWCGTHYAIFQSNCSNCGGPLPLPPARWELPPQGEPLPLPEPPPPPRPISSTYAWKLLVTDAIGITGLVFLLIGFIFTPLSILLLAISAETQLVGIIFGVLGMGFLIIGALLFSRRYRRAMGVVQVLRDGQSTRGMVSSIEEIYNVRVNGRHPWRIDYQYQVMGQQFTGKTSSLSQPSAAMLPGSPVTVLYLPDAPDHSALYPHP